jgi:hypothetical protein
MKCDAIDKDVAMRLINSSAKEPEEIAKIVLFFGVFFSLSAGFALALLFSLRRKIELKEATSQ